MSGDLLAWAVASAGAAGCVWALHDLRAQRRAARRAAIAQAELRMLEAAGRASAREQLLASAVAQVRAAKADVNVTLGVNIENAAAGFRAFAEALRQYDDAVDTLRDRPRFDGARIRFLQPVGRAAASDVVCWLCCGAAGPATESRVLYLDRRPTCLICALVVVEVFES